MKPISSQDVSNLLSDPLSRAVGASEDCGKIYKENQKCPITMELTAGHRLKTMWWTATTHKKIEKTGSLS